MRIRNKHLLAGVPSCRGFPYVFLRDGMMHRNQLLIYLPRAYSYVRIIIDGLPECPYGPHTCTAYTAVHVRARVCVGRGIHYPRAAASLPAPMQGPRLSACECSRLRASNPVPARRPLDSSLCAARIHFTPPWSGESYSWRMYTGFAAAYRRDVLPSSHALV